MVKDFIGKCDLLGAMHFWFNHIDRTMCGIACVIFQIMHRNCNRHQGIQQSFKNFTSLGIQHGGCSHQMTHVSDPQHRAPL